MPTVRRSPDEQGQVQPLPGRAVRGVWWGHQACLRRNARQRRRGGPQEVRPVGEEKGQVTGEKNEAGSLPSLGLRRPFFGGRGVCSSTSYHKRIDLSRRGET